MEDREIEPSFWKRLIVGVALSSALIYTGRIITQPIQHENPYYTIKEEIKNIFDKFSRDNSNRFNVN